MNKRTNLRKIGDSFHFLVPKSLIDVFDLEIYINTHDYIISSDTNGIRFSFTRVKKQSAQQLIDDINTEIKDANKN